MKRKRYPRLWPEWEDLEDRLKYVGIDVEQHPERPIHEQGVGFWLQALADGPVTRDIVGSIAGLVDDVIAEMKAKYEDQPGPGGAS